VHWFNATGSPIFGLEMEVVVRPPSGISVKSVEQFAIYAAGKWNINNADIKLFIFSPRTAFGGNNKYWCAFFTSCRDVFTAYSIWQKYWCTFFYILYAF
jgi:hypothetical protein